MPSLPVRSWYSLSEGFLSPEDLIKASVQAGGGPLVFADAGEVCAIPSILGEAEKAGVPVCAGVEFYLLHNNKLRRVSAFARGIDGLGALFGLAGQLRNPKEPNLPKGSLLPGEELSLPVGTMDQIGKGLILVSGGRGSFFEDCRSRGDIKSFLEFVDEVRAKGAGMAGGYDPGLRDSRDRMFLSGLRGHKKPVSILPWRWASYQAGQEELFYSAVRSVFSKSPDPVSLRVGGQIESMSYLTDQVFSDDEISGFTKVTQVMPGQFRLNGDGEHLSYVDGAGRALTQREACDLLKDRAVKNLDAMMGRAGLKGDKAKERRNFYLARVETEMTAIEQCGVGGRILYVADLMDYCRKNRIKAMTRGSVANSLVCYLNRITPLNPVTFNLPSERFINPKRQSTPDIDVDVAASRVGEVRQFLAGAGGGGVGLRSSVKAGFLDVLQRELRAAGVPYAHELRERVRAGMGGRKVPNTFDELEQEYLRHCQKSREVVHEGGVVGFIASRLSSVNPEVIEGAIQTARALEGRPVYHVEHVGVGMRVGKNNPLTPTLRGTDGKSVLAADHEDAESHGFSKIDILPRRALDAADTIQSTIEKNGGKVRAISSIFTPTKKPMAELRRGLLGGLDQIGPGGKSQIPHRRLLGSWEEDFSNFDLINYLALVRYGLHGWKKGGRPEGEYRPRMVALYCGSMAASHALEQLGVVVAKQAETELAGGELAEPWKKLIAVGSGGRDLSEIGKNEMLKILKKMPSTLAHTESLGGDDVGGRLLARITWGGDGDKRTHLAKCEEAVRLARRGDYSKMKDTLAKFYNLEPGAEILEGVCESLSSGRAIQRPDFVTKLGGKAVGSWDRVTADTRGLLLFQEQVTELLVDLSGCDYATCDVVRDVIAHPGKTIPQEVGRQILEGISKKTGGDGEPLLRALTDDGPYLFNKGHATVYAGLISWQLEAKKNWPASFTLATVENARKVGLKPAEAREMLGAVLGDAQALGCLVDATQLPGRAYTEVIDGAGGQSAVRLGLDFFLGISPSTLEKMARMDERGRERIGRISSSEDLTRMPMGLPPEDAEIIFSLARGGVGAMKTYQKFLGFVPESTRGQLVGDVGEAVPAESLNLYKPSCPKVSEVWGFVSSTPQISQGQGKRPCRVSCLLSTGDGREPVEISYVFWQERGKEAGGFLPKEAVELQARLNSLHQRGIPLSTVVRLNNFFGRWDGAVTTIKSVGPRSGANRAKLEQSEEGRGMSKPKQSKSVSEESIKTAGSRGGGDESPRP